MGFFKITLLRSGIGLPKRKNEVLAALGLRKRMQTVYHKVSQEAAGKIMAVKELIDVVEVDRALTKQEMKDLKRPPKGYFVESRPF